jgi:hypothetical protein
MQPIYKKVKVFKPHCPKCKEQLTGNNSDVLPYKCKCGTWQKDWWSSDFNIIPFPNK